MANKREKALREQENLKKRYQEQSKKILPLYIIAMVIGAAALLFYFFTWAAVDNTAYGIEVKVSGFSFAIATLTGKFSATGGVYGDVGVPFYYYAESQTVVVGILASVSLIAAIVSLGLVVATFAAKKHKLAYASAPLAILSAIAAFAAFFVALSMNDSQILPIYCSGNPKCSIVSYAIVTFMPLAAFAAAQCYAVIKFIILENNYKN